MLYLTTVHDSRHLATLYCDGDMFKIRAYFQTLANLQRQLWSKSARVIAEQS